MRVCTVSVSHETLFFSFLKDETLLLGLVIGLTCMLTVVRETIGGFVVGMVGRVFGGLLYVTSISCVLVSYIGTKFIYSCEKSSGVR